MYYNNYQKLAKIYHKNCIFNSDIFGLKISFNKKGILTGIFKFDDTYQGYDGIIHGGIISSIIDSVMTKYLFAHNIVAYTVRLNIKYSYPVAINKETIIKAIQKTKSKNNIYNIDAYIFQDDKKLVTAEAKFWAKNRTLS